MKVLISVLMRDALSGNGKEGNYSIWSMKWPGMMEQRKYDRKAELRASVMTRKKELWWDALLCWESVSWAKLKALSL